MEYKKIDGTWVIVLKKGDKIIEKLSDFVEAENIMSGYFRAIGAV
jgi:predicted DNA-binding protein with PD1-like motif